MHDLQAFRKEDFTLIVHIFLSGKADDFMYEQQEEKFVSLVSDTTVKYLWKNDNTKDWLNDIIKAKTGIDLKEFDIIDGEQNSGNKTLRDYRSDVTLSDKKEIVIIEMNGSYSESAEIKGRQYLYRRAGIVLTRKKNILKRKSL